MMIARIARAVRAGMCVAAFALATSASAQTPEFTYIRKDTRAASREATLGQYVPALQLGPWYVVGPFDNVGMDKHDVVYAPEARTTEVDLDATFTDRMNREARWEQVDDAEWSFIELKRYGSDELNENGVAYLFREVHADRAGRIEFNAGSDDGLKLWINGGLVIDIDAYRGFNVQDHRVAIDLKAGRNTIMAKVTQGTGGWEFQMQPVISTRVMALLKYHLDRDFPESPELAHYEMLSILEPEEIVLEVGGISVMPDGRPIVTTRRGEVWIVDGAYEIPPFNATYTPFAFGLHEPLGAYWRDGGLLVTQRGEVTRLVDEDGDDHADVFETYSSDWGVSGNYHEFAFGPETDGEGRLWITLNVGFCGSLGKSIVPWRGWALIVNDDGTTTPVCGGLRSPNGIGRNAAGAMFATDNQGDWVGTNKLMHLDFGDWHGHPAGNAWYEQAEMRTPRGEADFKPPAVWFPYDRLGRSASDILLDDTGGKFGPFTDHLFVGDQYSAEIMRVDLEQVNGAWQGACFPFLSGLDSGVNRLCWAPDGSLLVGMTNRGWWSHGPRAWGLQRVRYRGVVPFEVKSIRARADGFDLVFTKPVDAASATDPAHYAVTSFTHHRWEKYGSPEIDHADHRVSRVVVSDDGLTARLTLDRVRRRHVHEITLSADIVSREGDALLHDVGWYTLNEVPAR